MQWLNPNAFVSAVDPEYEGFVLAATLILRIASSATSPDGTLCAVPISRGGDFYLTKWFTLRGHVKLRLEGQAFNLFNHPNFALPTVVYAGIPGRPSTQTGFGALTYATAPPTGLLGVGLGGDSSPRMIAFQARLEF